MQHVQVGWTKQSRDGQPATQRNRVPTAYPLTDGKHLAAVHLVAHHEADDFLRAQKRLTSQAWESGCGTPSLRSIAIATSCEPNQRIDERGIGLRRTLSGSRTPTYQMISKSLTCR